MKAALANPMPGPMRAAARAVLAPVLALMLAPSPARADHRHTGFEDMTPALQALQRDDAQNPAFLWLKAGEQRFAAACARCHDLAGLRGVAARYPAFDEHSSRPVTLAQRINLCQVRQVRAAAWPADSEALLELETAVAHRSRGLPISPPADARLDAWRQRGQRLFNQRLGQLDLACAECHDQRAGLRLGGSTIPQGHPTGYPIYRLEWQAPGSLPRRLRGCMTGVRAQPWAADSDEMLALEIYLMQRAAGLTMDGPAVRP
jgi:sulfur-oxidizing protein SoxA